jgi:hypothetical protein
MAKGQMRSNKEKKKPKKAPPAKVKPGQTAGSGGSSPAPAKPFEKKW